MHAMILEAPGTSLRQAGIPLPPLSAHEILLEENACDVCRTELHMVDGELAVLTMEQS